MNTSIHPLDTVGTAYALAIALHVDAICAHAELCTSNTNPASAADIAMHEAALRAMGLTQADIYSHVNRAAVPTDC